jgi:SAM-dependent methyltransferase
LTNIILNVKNKNCQQFFIQSNKPNKRRFIMQTTVTPKTCVRGENAMAGKSISCLKLIEAYDLPEEKKLPHLTTPHTVELLKSMPKNISDALVSGFLAGKGLLEMGESEVIDYWQTHSVMIPRVTEYPGTYSMLEHMYGLKEVSLPIDVYFQKNLHAGISLEGRYHAINARAKEHIFEILSRQENCLVLDLGSGPGRNCIALSLENPEIANRVEFHCVDTDPEAVEHGLKLVKQHGLDNIKFIERSMTRLHKYYKQSADYGLLIGVLCGLGAEERIGLLKIMHHYFKPGARVIGAGLMDRVLELDLFCAYILREITGWVLQHQPLGSTEKAFRSAGYDYEGFFHEEPTRCYEIGIGLA